MVKRKAKVIPLVPLEPGTIFLPGVNYLLSTSERPDVAALLSHIHGRVLSPISSKIGSASPAVLIGCIPLRSPHISKDGKRLITSGATTDVKYDDEGEASGKMEKLKSQIVDVNKAREQDLYGYGVLAKVLEVQGTRRGDMTILVEGLSRFEVKEVMQERPYFRAKVVVYEDEGTSSMSQRSLIIFVSYFVIPC